MCITSWPILFWEQISLSYSIGGTIARVQSGYLLSLHSIFCMLMHKTKYHYYYYHKNVLWNKKVLYFKRIVYLVPSYDINSNFDQTKKRLTVILYQVVMGAHADLKKNQKDLVSLMQTVSKLLKPLSFLRVSLPPPLYEGLSVTVWDAKRSPHPSSQWPPYGNSWLRPCIYHSRHLWAYTAYYTTRFIQRKKYLLQSAFDNFSMTTIHVTEDFR